MSVETARALEQALAIVDLQRKELESLRAVLVHIRLDIQEWRDGDAWSDATLRVVDKRAREKLEEPPAVFDGWEHKAVGEKGNP